MMRVCKTIYPQSNIKQELLFQIEHKIHCDDSARNKEISLHSYINVLCSCLNCVNAT